MRATGARRAGLRNGWGWFSWGLSAVCIAASFWERVTRGVGGGQWVCVRGAALRQAQGERGGGRSVGWGWALAWGRAATRAAPTMRGGVGARRGLVMGGVGTVAPPFVLRFPSARTDVGVGGHKGRPYGVGRVGGAEGVVGGRGGRWRAPVRASISLSTNGRGAGGVGGTMVACGGAGFPPVGGTGGSRPAPTVGVRWGGVRSVRRGSPAFAGAGSAFAGTTVGVRGCAEVARLPRGGASGGGRLGLLRGPGFGRSRL